MGGKQLGGGQELVQRLFKVNWPTNKNNFA
jgi:hypothetical protein